MARDLYFRNDIMHNLLASNEDLKLVMKQIKLVVNNMYEFGFEEHKGAKLDYVLSFNDDHKFNIIFTIELEGTIIKVDPLQNKCVVLNKAKGRKKGISNDHLGLIEPLKIAGNSHLCYDQFSTGFK